MRDLIERLEKAREPDRELDIAIYLALGAKEPPADKPLYWTSPDGRTQHYEGLIPHYTASADNALTLIPSGYDYGFAFSKQYGIEAWVQKPFKEGTCHQGYAPEGVGGDTTRAIAICIAALYAREASNASSAQRTEP